MENREGGVEQVPSKEIKGYKALKALSPSDLESGNIVVHGLTPSKLWATQDWISEAKIARAGVKPPNAADEARLLLAYFRDMPTGQRAIILGDGHHNALLATEKGEKISVRIVGPLPDGKDFRSFSRFRREAGNPFRDIHIRG